MASSTPAPTRAESIWIAYNDVHDAWTPEFVSDWKQQDPTRVMSTLEQSKSFNDRRRLWSLVDFEHPDVEPRLVEIVQEVLQSYDIDGVELDFLRAPIYFRTAEEGRPVTDAQRGILTGSADSRWWRKASGNASRFCSRHAFR
jgi:uncharacterized lipoprotein YddW (UPF0748 family)